MQPTDRNGKHTHRIARLEKLARSMDARWRLPGTSLHVGWDALLGLLPGIGDTATALISLYIIREAHQLGAPLLLKMRMGLNMLIDWLVGSVPLLGDVFDVAWKANQRNVALLMRHLQQQDRQQ